MNSSCNWYSLDWSNAKHYRYCCHRI